MILVGNQRGNSRDMAAHLLKPENEKVIVHQIRGFMGNDLHSAFQESYAISRGTKCNKHLYSLSLNPPKDADVSEREFEVAIDRAEERLGLTDQPRAIVFHLKRGRDGELRRHAHCVWCRINTDTMKAIQISYDHPKLQSLGRELYLEYGWDMPAGFVNKADRDPLNFTHREYQQANRAQKEIRVIKAIFQNAWASSDSKPSFSAALKEQGYILARGDRRGFVAVDAQGEVYGIARNVGIKTKEVRSRLGEPDNLPSVEQAHEIAVSLSKTCLKEIYTDQAQVQSSLSNHQPATATKAPDQRPELDNSPIAKRIRKNPEYLLSMLTDKESTFTRHNIAKALSTYIHDATEYGRAYEKIISSSNIVQLTPENTNPKIKTRYSTREMVELEQKLIDDAKGMANNSSFRIPSRQVELAIRKTNKTLHADAGVVLSAEQRKAIRNVTSGNQLSCIIGVAGAGKSTILAAARQAWEEQGHRVFGAALAGKAAKGLEQSSGIQSRTLASLELSWQNDLHHLQKGDVLVIDEAGMIGSRQMARFINEAKVKGAKLALIGDAEQLQPIEAGSPFRAITEQIQTVSMHEVHRQNQVWQKQASQNFALGNTQRALHAYEDHNAIEYADTQDNAIQALVSDYMNDFWRSDNNTSQLALAHRKIDVQAINQTIRETRKEVGELQDGQAYKTEHGRRVFAAGDRLLFTRNDRGIGVQNGMLGTVTKIDSHHLTIELDDKENGQSTTRTISIKDYNNIEHGYATTIHKSQGATVDKSYLLASNSMDRHLTYVAMTRHKQETKIYTNQEEFLDFGRLTNSLSRKRQKQSTLDVVQNHSRDLQREVFKAKRRSQSRRPEQRRSKARDGPEFGM